MKVWCSCKQSATLLGIERVYSKVFFNLLGYNQLSAQVADVSGPSNLQDPVLQSCRKNLLVSTLRKYYYDTIYFFPNKVLILSWIVGMNKVESKSTQAKGTTRGTSAPLAPLMVSISSLAQIRLDSRMHVLR